MLAEVRESALLVSDEEPEIWTESRFAFREIGPALQLVDGMIHVVARSENGLLHVLGRTAERPAR